MLSTMETNTPLQNLSWGDVYSMLLSFWLSNNFLFSHPIQLFFSASFNALDSKTSNKSLFSFKNEDSVSSSLLASNRSKSWFRAVLFHQLLRMLFQITDNKVIWKFSSVFRNPEAPNCVDGIWVSSLFSTSRGSSCWLIFKAQRASALAHHCVALRCSTISFFIFFFITIFNMPF